jgi:hypothetical protein
MNRRLELHEILCEKLGSRNVYFQPPESIKMKYPAIVYSLSDVVVRHANNANYNMHRVYDITIIDVNPDTTILDSILELPYTSFDRAFVSDNLNHFILTINY